MHDAACHLQNLIQRSLSRVGLLALCVSTLAVSGACAKAEVVSLVPDGPPLAIPAPPPRVIEPVEELAAAPAPP